MNIKLVVADLDGTLLDPRKRITPAAAKSVAELKKNGIQFTLVSGRPPFGMRMYSDLLGIELPLCGFNGGEITSPDFKSIQRLELSRQTALEIAEFFESKKLQYWIYRSSDWLLLEDTAPHVQKEARNVGFSPTVVPSFEGHWKGITKIVAIADDHEYLADCEKEGLGLFQGKANMARSQAYYLDVTHPEANKEVFIQYLSKELGIEREAIATIGDMPSDLPMFTGFSIAMGNASDEVKSKARFVTRSNAEDGFAYAMRDYVLQTVSRSEDDTAIPA